MDKRTILALALVAVVIIITPRLFPSSMVSRTAATDSAATQSGTQPASDSVGAETVPASPETAAARQPVNAGVTKTAELVDTSSTRTVSAESTVVESANAAFVFSSAGAAPVEVRLPTYRALDKVNEKVALMAGAGKALLSFRVLGTADTVSLSSVNFELERATATNGDQLLTYRGTANGRAVTLKYTVVADSFLARVQGEVGNNEAGDPARFVLIDLPTTFRSFEADSLDDQNHFAYAIKPRSRNAEGVPFGKLDPGERKVVPGPLTWAAAKSKYFIVGVLAHEGDDAFAEAYAVGGVRTTKRATQAMGTVVARVNNGSFAFDLYSGPQQYNRLRALGREFENSNPYGGWLQGVVQPFATLVMRILLWMRATLKLDYGWLLVIFGVAVRLILWPLNHGAMRTSMKMQRIQPELNDIQKRYKADPQKMQSEMMRVYKEHDMSPFSTFAGCLPLLLPMPVLFALFFVFQNTIEFRGVPFLWLADISIKDPYYAVPLLMGVSMFLLSWVGMRNAPPNPQAKMMLYIFPVMMTFLFANFASGLNLYYAVQNIAAIPQQWLIAHERGKQGGGGKKA